MLEQVVVVTRPGVVTVPEEEEKCGSGGGEVKVRSHESSTTGAQGEPKVSFHHVPMLRPISSTEIRSFSDPLHLTNSRDMDPRVSAYILAHSLYGFTHPATAAEFPA